MALVPGIVPTASAVTLGFVGSGSSAACETATLMVTGALTKPFLSVAITWTVNVPGASKR